MSNWRIRRSGIDRRRPAILVRAAICAGLIAAFVPRPARAQQGLAERVVHPDRAAILLGGIGFRSDTIIVSATLVNGGDRAIRLNVDGSCRLEDGAGGIYRLNPPADNAALQIPAASRVAAQLVFVGPLNPAARRLALTTNEGIGTTDNPYDATPVLRAVLPVSQAGGGWQANHPDGAALRISDVEATPTGFAVSLLATNGNNREISLNQDNGLVLETGAGAAVPVAPPAGDPALVLPPGERLTGTLVFPSRAANGIARVTISTNEATGGTPDNPYETLPVFRLTVPVGHGETASVAQSRVALTLLPRSQLSAPVPLSSAVASAAPIAPASPAAAPAVAPPPPASAPAARPATALAPAPVALPAPARPPPAPVAQAPATPEPAAVALPSLPPARMTIAQLKAALRPEESVLGLRIVLPADSLFGPPPGSGDTLEGAGPIMLEEAARLIAAVHPREVVVAGNTDGVGRDDANLALSERRAEAVAGWLERHDSGRRLRVVAKGYGRTRPVAPNHNPDGSDNPAGRAQNRRLELYLRG